MDFSGGSSGSSSAVDGGGTDPTDPTDPDEKTETDPLEEDLVGDYDFSVETGEYEISGAVETEGIAGPAIEFDRYDDYVIIPDSEALDLSEAGSLSVWIKAASHRPYAGVLHKGEKKDFSDETWTLQFWGTGIIAILVRGEDGSLLKVQSTITMNTDEWYHVSATWDTEEVSLYINGSLDGCLENTVDPIRTSDGGLVIGAQLSETYSDSYGHIGFDGIIDEVKIFSRVLDADEVMALYDSVTVE
jgi:hypothetical protein